MKTHETLKNQLNQQYSSLCTQLGDSILKAEKLSQHIQSLKDEINSLNKKSIQLDELNNLYSQETSND